MRRIIFALASFLCFSFHSAHAQSVERLNIEGAVGKLSAVLHMPAFKKGEKCPLAILCHGFTGSKEAELLTTLADSLQAAGIASIRFDFNGHGESEGDFVRMTVPNEVEDAKCVYRYVANLPDVDVAKIALVGHSQGGVVTGMAAGDLGSGRVAAIVLLAPAAVLRDDAIRGNTMGVTYDPLSPPSYVTMPDGHHLGREYILTAFRLPIYETSAKYHGPACMIHGTGDRIAPYTYSEHYRDIWPGSALHLIEAADHGFSGQIANVVHIASNFLVRYLK